MSSGGARTRSGPAPDPNALRRGRADDAEWISLPSTGRGESAPEWPLPANPDGAMRERELVLWRKLWEKPQAVAWDRFDLTHEVALYVRRLAEAELPDSPTALSTLVRQMGDALGLSVPGLRSLRWKIEEGPKKPGETAAPARKSSRDRLRVVTRDSE